MPVSSNRLIIKLLGLLGISALVVGVVVLGFRHPRETNGDTPPSKPLESSDKVASTASAISVKVIRPKPDPQGFEWSITQPAIVTAFYQADLMSHVAGEVKRVDKNIGELVTQGEVLIELDAPDLVQDVRQKEALVKQAREDVRAAETDITVAIASEKAEETKIAEKMADVDRAQATYRFRKAELQRFMELADRNAVVSGVVDERKRDTEAAEANVKSCEISVKTASANLEEFAAKSAAARINVDVKKAKLEVAQADVAKAQAMLEYAKIKSPFDGMITARNVSPGTFVQSAITGKPTPLLSVVKTDLVTAVMWVPEKETPMVDQQTEAIIRLDALGERVIRTHLTRLSYCLDPTHSRDMRVEVDLRNLPDRVEPVAEGSKNDLPKQSAPGVLRPGMYGSMTLTLQKFARAFLVPSSAVFQRKNRSFIFEVTEGKAHLVPVRVLLEDGIKTIVLRISRTQNVKTGGEVEKLEELTGAESIIRSGQGEIADEQAVEAQEVSW